MKINLKGIIDQMAKDSNGVFKRRSDQLQSRINWGVGIAVVTLIAGLGVDIWLSIDWLELTLRITNLLATVVFIWNLASKASMTDDIIGAYKMMMELSNSELPEITITRCNAQEPKVDQKEADQSGNPERKLTVNNHEPKKEAKKVASTRSKGATPKK